MTGGKQVPTMDGVMHNERGVAMMTVVLIMLMMTVLGLSALTVTGMENRMAGFAMRTESATTAAESCVGTSVNIIQQTIDQGALPAAFLASATPVGPVPVSNSTVLNQEILGQSDRNPDSPTGTGAAPNLVLTVNNYTVNGDIDRLYAKAKSGSGMQMFAAHDGIGAGTPSGGIDIYYRLDCVATNAATGTTARVSAVYACTASGDSCQK